MKNDFEAIDPSALVTVTGGVDGPEGGPNRMKAEGELDVETPIGVKIKGKGSYEQQQTNYAKCLDTYSRMPGITPEKLSQACPLPGAK